MNHSVISNIRFTVLTILMFIVLLPMTSENVSANNDEPILKTGLEIRNDGSWTTHEEEVEFIEKLAELSDRVEYEVYGETAEGRPMHLVKVSHPSPKSNEEIAKGRTILIEGTFHGNEPSGREMALKTMRDLAFTDDPDMIELMEKSTILFLPTVNPDGREANRRRNADNYDINRDSVKLITPEGQTLAKIMNDFQPDIVLDAHERMSGPNMSLLGNQNIMVDPDLKALNDRLIEDYMFEALEEEGFTYTYYPASEKAYPTNARGVSGFRHSLGILTEASWLDENLDRVDAQMVAVKSLLEFYYENFNEVGEVVENSRKNHKKRGEEANQPFYLEGRHGDEIENENAILDPPPCGYTINEEQKKRISRQIELFSIEYEEIKDGYYIPMGQEMMAIIPYIMDENSRTKLINAKRIYDCSDIDNLEVPVTPRPEVFETDFSEYQAEEVPEDWTDFWGESQWTIKDNPSRLEHIVTEGDDNRLLIWDKVGEVHGDVEVAALIRTDQEGELFRIHLDGYGDADSTDSYYLDVRSQHGKSEIQINRLIGSLYKSLAKESLDFHVDVDTWYQIVFKHEGNSLKGKIWEFGEKEPKKWQIEVDDVYLNFGNVGIGHKTVGVINDLKYFSVGTYGAKAKRATEDLLSDVDKSVLQRRVQQIEDENLDEDIHLEDSWENLQKALEKAKEVLERDDVTQEEVDQANKELYKAYTELSAQYVTDFTEYEVGTKPEDWTMLWRDSNWIINDDPRRLTHRLSDDGSGRRAMTWDVPGNITGDVEVYTLVRKSNTTNGVMFQLHLQASGTSGDENSYYLDVRNNGNIRINRNRAGGFSSLKSEFVPGSSELNTWYEVVFSRKGNKLRGKVWRYGEEEPDDWQIELEDENFFSGRVGLGHVTNSVVNDYAYFSVGTANAEAPRAPKDLLVDILPLEEKIDEIEGLDLDPNDFSKESWTNLVNTLDEAKEMLDNTDGITQTDIVEMVKKIDHAYNKLQSATKQYQTDFSEYEVGQAPHDWTLLWRESGWTIKDNPSRLEHYVTPGGKRRVLTWDKVGEIYGAVEVSTLVKSRDVGGQTMFQLHLHGTGDAGTETSYYLDLRTTNAVRINRNNGGAFNTLTSSKVPFTVEEDVWYQAVLRYEDSVLKGKVWPFGEEEPEEWQVEVIDENFTKGKVGLGHVSSGVTNDYAFFGVGIGDEEAPRAPEDIFDTVDKSQLSSLISEIEEASLDESDYTPGSWLVFEAALKEAQEILDDSEVDQEAVDEAYEHLNLAYQSLVVIEEIDESALQELISSIEEKALDESNYTEDSWSAFDTALVIAQEVLKVPEIDKRVIEKAYINLEVAYEFLVPVDEEVQ